MWVIPSSLDSANDHLLARSVPGCILVVWLLQASFASNIGIMSTTICLAHFLLRMSEKRANKEDGESEVVSDPISDQSDQHKRGHDRDGQKDPKHDRDGQKDPKHDRDGQRHPMVTQERWQQGKVCDCRKSLTNIHANGPLARCEIEVTNKTRHGLYLQHFRSERSSGRSYRPGRCETAPLSEFPRLNLRC